MSYLYGSVICVMLKLTSTSCAHLYSISRCRKFANVFGSSRLLGSLALSPPGMRRKDETAINKANFAKDREVRNTF